MPSGLYAPYNCNCSIHIVAQQQELPYKYSSCIAAAAVCTCTTNCLLILLVTQYYTTAERLLDNKNKARHDRPVLCTAPAHQRTWRDHHDSRPLAARTSPRVCRWVLVKPPRCVRRRQTRWSKSERNRSPHVEELVYSADRPSILGGAIPEASYRWVRRTVQIFI